MQKENAPALEQKLLKENLSYGIYEEVINEALSRKIAESINLGYSETDETLMADGSEEYLARYMQKALLVGLRVIKEKAAKKISSKAKDPEKNELILREEIDACNKIIELLSSISDVKDLLELKIGPKQKRLLSIWKSQDLCRPRTSISVSTLFTGGASSDFRLNEELSKEIRSSNRVDFIVSFIKSSGINLIRSALNDFVSWGGKLRILTTTYMGATEPNIVRELAKMDNVEVRISYNSQSTRLHAKAYIFDRINGFSTAYIGSSNLSKAAVTEGMEWNVKVTNQDAPQIINEIRATFDIYWNSSDFEVFDPEKDYERLCEAVGREKNKTQRKGFVSFNIVPYPFQEELLQELRAQREIHGNYRNLMVAATGTGKTVISAFDYDRFCKAHKDSPNRLLFIAHRKEILEKSLETYRAVLRNQNFGQLYVGGEVATNYNYLFMSIQTFNSRDFENLDEDYYDFIVVDEVHHGAAKSYHALLTHFKPKILLGMTATPERHDFKDITQYFGSTIACELRLPEAINRELLVPFQYYAVSDPVDISSIKFTKGEYDRKELSERYIGNNRRISAIKGAIERYRPEKESIRGIGFCVNKEHAEYMAQVFNSIDYPSVAVTADTPDTIRDEVCRNLSVGKIQFIFAVDIYNEGVDIPEINLELLLRPTESKTVFIQQLGRGLRKADNKTELVVLDFVGQYNKNYTVYEDKLRSMCCDTAKTFSIADQIENGFSKVPLGCYIELEKQAKADILKNLSAASVNKKRIMSKLHEFYTNTGSIPSVEDFCNYFTIDPKLIYHTNNSLISLCKEADIYPDNIHEGEITPSALMRISRINSRRWIAAVIRMLEGNANPNSETDLLYATMFYYTIKQQSLSENYRNVWHFIDTIAQNKVISAEICSLLSFNLHKLDFVDEPVDLGFTHTLDLHCSYTQDQILAALGKSTAQKAYSWREGVLFIKDDGKNTDVFINSFVKDEKEYSPTTMYEDYPISQRLFHWQSQSNASPNTGDGKRYVEGSARNTLLFVREKRADKYGTLPYVFLGKATLVSYEGEKPMNIVWKLEKDIPTWVLAWSPLYKG